MPSGPTYFPFDRVFVAEVATLAGRLSGLATLRGAICCVTGFLLAGCEGTSEVYVPPRPYTIPVPEIPAPVTETPLPEPPSFTVLPPPPSMAPAAPDPMPELATPVPPPADADAPRDPVEDVLLKPPPANDARATPLSGGGLQANPPAPPETGGAVPLMGFRPMRGQKSPGA